MNRGNVVQQSSPAQQMVAGGGPNSWWSTVSPFPSPPQQSPYFAASTAAPLSPEPPLFFPQQYAPPPSLSSWLDNQDNFPDSLTQLLMSGAVREEDKSILSHLEQMNKPENYVKKENSLNNYASYGHENVEIQGLKATNWSNSMIQDSSNSCVTSCNFLDFSTTTTKKVAGRHPPQDRSSECNSTATGGATKKAKIQPSSTQSTFKVRKEKLGDRITALHQLVSPFGKTDTASVLLEAIGYIRFLQTQIQALSLPYMGNASRRMIDHQHSINQQGEQNCLFPEDSGELFNDNRMKRKSASDQDSHEETKKDLRSRGLCLVPIPCTMQVGSDNGADYWNGGY